MTSLANNLKRGFQPIGARTPPRAETAEGWRDLKLTEIEVLIANLHENDPAAASEAEQQMKLLRLRNNAEWWLARRSWTAKMLLRNP